MSVSYKKLWKLLIDKDMKKKDLCEKAGISPASVTKMGRNGHVTTEILVKICAALDCQIEDIVEIVVGFVDQRNKKQQDKSTDKVSDGVKGKGTDIFHSDTLGDKRDAPDKSC